ncbi:MAG TPA: glycosyltransferase family 2 protein [Polyangiaceae bacterium]|jgi:glycosyltransferase involved in cell wall biosynthesis
MISLVMPTYNRRATIGRAIASVRAQTHAEWELVIVDDGSIDDTASVVAAFRDARIRFVREPENAGVTAARNRGLDEARGDFIGMLDSDDELVPRALETLLGALRTVSPRLDAISCNCVDSLTGRFTGHGLDRDRFLTVPLSLDRARGEHWGIFHRRILGARRFDPRVRGFEGHLWYRIHDGALWYYLHQGLRIYHREGSDRLSKRDDYELYAQIFDHDPELLRLYARWSKKAFVRLVRTAGLHFLRAGDARRLGLAWRALRSVM